MLTFPDALDWLPHDEEGTTKNEETSGPTTQEGCKGSENHSGVEGLMTSPNVLFELAQLNTTCENYPIHLPSHVPNLSAFPKKRLWDGGFLAAQRVPMKKG